MLLHVFSPSDDVYDEGEDVKIELKGMERLKNGNYRLKLPIPSVFFKYIIGKEGRIKKGIERDTECHLWLPSKGREGDVGKQNIIKVNCPMFLFRKPADVCL